MAAFIIRALELEPVGETPEDPLLGTFEDVPSSHSFAGVIERLALLGITVGCETGPPLLYCPQGDVTRAEMAVFLVRALSEVEPVASPTGIFNDVSAGHFAEAFME